MEPAGPKDSTPSAAKDGADCVDDTVGSPAPSPEAGLEDTLALPAAGTLIAGRYLLGQRVAHGGMGAIYAGTDNRLGRKVAVKLMLETVSSLPGFSERFEREARAASRISHPHCVVVHDFGVDQGRHYLVLEWVEGQSLAALVASEGPLSPERAADLVSQVCDGLAAAHARGIIHRDVKPENVMVSRGPDGRELAKLVDFGIARSLEASEPQLTQAGLTIGSPYFMSPEQAMADPVDPRSDVYSAGATLFFLLSGRRPYLGDRLAVLQQLVHAQPPDLPPALLTHPIAAITRRAMQKSREARQPSAAELSSELRALARQPAFAWRRSWRRPAIIAAASAAGLAILLALGLSIAAASRHGDIEALLESGRASAAQSLAERRLEETPRDPQLLLLRGHAQAARGDQEGARSSYQGAVRAAPDLASDETLVANALEWLDAGNAGPAVEFWRSAIGQEGLTALREASTRPERHLRWNAIALRLQLRDPEPPDLVAASIQDLEPATDCGVLRGAAARLRDAGDPRGLQPLVETRGRLNLVDQLCAGPVLDEAIQKLGGDLDAEPSPGPMDARAARTLAEEFAREQGLQVRKFKLERDQGRYSVKLKGRGREVELEIDATTGELRVRKDE